MSTLTKELLSSMTPEDRVKLAASMVAPMRCGGCHYDEQGRRIYMHGGVWMLEDGPEYKALRRMHGYHD
jgi:hypothetical protein